MLLSDAIALGRVLIEEPSGTSYCRCALAMGLASNGKRFDNDYLAKMAAFQEWPFIANRVDPPAQIAVFWVLDFWTIDVCISRMFSMACNNCEGVTLESIIDWVRSVEPQEEPAKIAQETDNTADSVLVQP